MGNSLFDQLQKVGLVDEKRAKKAKQHKHQQLKQQKGKKAKPADTQHTQQAQAEKAARDRELNQQRKAAAERKAVAAQVRQLIETHRIAERDGEIAFNFPDGGKVRRIHVSDKVQGQLARGQLAIVALDGRYELVPADTADKIRQRDPDGVILRNDAPQLPDTAADDPYAAFQVPDDLMW